MSQQLKKGLMQQLKAYFNLASDPFSEESGFYFEGAQRQHNLETLRHLASFGDMVLFVTADKGAGKTYLLRKLADSSFDGLNIIYLDCAQLLQGSNKYTHSILNACFQALGLDMPEGSLVNQLNALLTECHRLVAADGVRTLFAFDNADKIPKKELQEYCAFCKGLPTESALVMLFAGSSALIQSSKLSGQVDQDVWWHQIQLKPFSKADVILYLEQALALVGHTGKLELSDLQIQQLVDLGKGLPGRVNKLFPSVVLEPGLLKIKKKSEPKTGAVGVMFGLAGLLVLSFIFVSFQHGLFDSFVPVFSFEDEQVQQELDLVDENKDKLLAQKNDQQRSRLAMLDSVLKEKGIQLPVDQELLAEDDMARVQTEIENSEVDSGDSGIESKKKLKVAAPIEADSLAETPNDEADVIAEDRSQELTKVEPVAKETNKEQVQKLETVESNRSPAYRTKAWLQAQPEGAYLAQILGSYSEQTALKFIKKIGKQKFEVFYLETEHRGKPWFVVFYGAFPAKTHAQDAVKNSPKIIRSQNPWIRRSSEVLASYPK